MAANKNQRDALDALSKLLVAGDPAISKLLLGALKAQPGANAFETFITWVKTDDPSEESFVKFLLSSACPTDQQAEFAKLRIYHKALHDEFKSWPIANACIKEPSLRDCHTDPDMRSANNLLILQWVDAYKKVHPAPPKPQGKGGGRGGGRGRGRNQQQQQQQPKNSSGSEAAAPGKPAVKPPAAAK
jgi:hypothetical protein